jgi:predicted CDP-diglyceride synthetase/phosphatidate cytidylyltransferase
VALYALVVVAATVLGLWLGSRLARRLGYEAGLRARLRAWAMVALCTAVTSFAVWELTHDEPAIGLAVLVVFLVLPELVLVPLRIKRSRRAADEARARRRAVPRRP